MNINVNDVVNYKGKPHVVTSGQYYGESGGISNFWYLSAILKDGSLGRPKGMYNNTYNIQPCPDRYRVKYVKIRKFKIHEKPKI